MECWSDGVLECWSDGVMEYCAKSELHPASAGLELLSWHWVIPLPVRRPWRQMF